MLPTQIFADDFLTSNLVAIPASPGGWLRDPKCTKAADVDSYLSLEIHNHLLSLSTLLSPILNERKELQKLRTESVMRSARIKAVQDTRTDRESPRARLSESLTALIDGNKMVVSCGGPISVC